MCHLFPTGIEMALFIHMEKPIVLAPLSKYFFISLFIKKSHFYDIFPYIYGSVSGLLSVHFIPFRFVSKSFCKTQESIF